MARRGSWSLLRRRGTPAGGLALLCVVLAVPAQAATPAPDPPPEAVSPEPPPAATDAAAPGAQRPGARDAGAGRAPGRAGHAHPAGAEAGGEAEAGREAEAAREDEAGRVDQPQRARRTPHDRAACRSRARAPSTSSTGAFSRSPAARFCSSRSAAESCSVAVADVTRRLAWLEAPAPALARSLRSGSRSVGTRRRRRRSTHASLLTWRRMAARGWYTDQCHDHVALTWDAGGAPQDCDFADDLSGHAGRRNSGQLQRVVRWPADVTTIVTDPERRDARRR